MLLSFINTITLNNTFYVSIYNHCHILIKKHIENLWGITTFKISIFQYLRYFNYLFIFEIYIKVLQINLITKGLILDG